jgi:transcriptional regulator with XRE-family HTH domain
MTDKSRKQIGSKLREIRRSQGLTQSELAAKAGLSSNYYARTEQGKVKASLDTYESIIKALKVKSSEVLPF